MIGESGVAIFMFGNKNDNDGKVITANGVIREFNIAQKQNKFVIPIGSTGYATRDIFQKIKNGIDKYWYLKDSIDILENEKDPKKLIDEILEIINRIRGN